MCALQYTTILLVRIYIRDLGLFLHTAPDRRLVVRGTGDSDAMRALSQDIGSYGLRLSTERTICRPPSLGLLAWRYL
jgi:hypothetical protein